MARHPEVPLPNPGGADGIDEVGDDAIIAQETGAHAPQPRANVRIEQPSVVVSEQAPLVPPLVRRRGSTDKTVVIRDRRAIDEVRRKVKEDRARQLRKKRLVTISIWFFAGAIAFGLGGVFALLASRSDDGTATEQLPSAAPPAAEQPPPQIVDLDQSEPATQPEPPAASVDAVDLEALPVEKLPAEPAPKKRPRSTTPKAKPESTVYVPF